MTLAGRKPRNIFDEYARRRLAEQAEDARRNGGPRPYRADEAGTVPCPNCDLLAWPDSMVCPYCAARMPNPAESVTDERDTVVCPACLERNSPLSSWCDQCGSSLPPSAYAAADQAKEAKAYGVPGVWGPDAQSSSAGRRPGLSPAERNAVLAERNAALGQQAQRADLLAAYRQGRDGDPFLYQLSRCEDLVRQCEADLDHAQQAMRDARYDFGGDVALARARYLDPELRERFAEYSAAEAGVAAAMTAVQSAKRLQSELLAEYDDISRAFQLGRVPDIV